MTNSGDLCDLHPGISAGFSASPAASHSGTFRASSLLDISAGLSASPVVSHSGTSRAASLRQTNPHSQHSSTLSKTTGLSRHDSLLTGERPNTDASFSVLLSTESLLPSAANVLRADGIADLLKTYPNQRFVDTLMFIAICGTRVDFQGHPFDHIRLPNHFSTFAHPEIIMESIQNELQKEYIKQISSLP